MKNNMNRIESHRFDYLQIENFPWWKFWDFRSGTVGGTILGMIIGMTLVGIVGMTLAGIIGAIRVFWG